MNADGSGQQRLTSDLGWVSGLAWSPDGRAIAFSRPPLNFGGYSEIYVVNADGSEQRMLTRTTAEGSDSHHLAWSPRGDKIALVSKRDGNLEIYVMNTDGSGLSNLTRDTRTEWNPEWSPDGRKIAFGRLEPGGRSKIVVMKADGSGKRTLADGADPVWSPDGRMIAFTSPRSGRWEIYAMNADGSGQRNLSR
jgi:TolB protein